MYGACFLWPSLRSAAERPMMKDSLECTRPSVRLARLCPPRATNTSSASYDSLSVHLAVKASVRNDYTFQSEEKSYDCRNSAKDRTHVNHSSVQSSMMHLLYVEGELVFANHSKSGLHSDACSTVHQMVTLGANAWGKLHALRHVNLSGMTSMEEAKRHITLLSLLQKTGLENHGAPVDAEQLKETVVGFYFSAHWCPPCRQFTPLLKQAYEAINATGKRLEIVFVSSDHDEKEFEEYYRTMPWLAVPFAARSAQRAMASRFNITGIPALVLIENGEVINASARSAVMKDPQGAEFPWRGQEDKAGQGGFNWMLIVVAIVLILVKYVFKLF